MAQPRIGFLGAGLMGHGMAKNLIQKGFEVTLLAHRNRKPIEDLLAKGAKEAKSPRDVAAASDVVILVLPSSKVIEAVMDAPDGLRKGLRAGMTVIDCSTADPASTMKLAASLKGAGIRFIDAPLARTPKEAEEGRLNLMLGGDQALADELKPILGAFCENVFPCGALGAGHKMKLLNNFMAMTHAATVAEVARTTKAVGLSFRTLHEIVSKGGANSAMLQMMAPKVLGEGPGGPLFSLPNASKDYGYYAAMATQAGTLGPLAAGGRQIFLAAAAAMPDGIVADLPSIKVPLPPAPKAAPAKPKPVKRAAAKKAKAKPKKASARKPAARKAAAKRPAVRKPAKKGATKKRLAKRR
ncbi:MAG: NAD(P)-dependent oxidoreductase [Alphaproteobacteria bacterium]|nr:NAD(P)-dependent oxidoreductase [Alphaproteobacteria bacterium]